jgi:hypothetical protein
MGNRKVTDEIFAEVKKMLSFGAQKDEIIATTGLSPMSVYYIDKAADVEEYRMFQSTKNYFNPGIRSNRESMPQIIHNISETLEKVLYTLETISKQIERQEGEKK